MFSLIVILELRFWSVTVKEEGQESRGQFIQELGQFVSVVEVKAPRDGYLKWSDVYPTITR